jgi:hypothetical protein
MDVSYLWPCRQLCAGLNLSKTAACNCSVLLLLHSAAAHLLRCCKEESRSAVTDAVQWVPAPNEGLKSQKGADSEVHMNVQMSHAHHTVAGMNGSAHPPHMHVASGERPSDRSGLVTGPDHELSSWPAHGQYQTPAQHLSADTHKETLDK